jgi:RimJ/RimL family protein N-acetyltransferase
MQAYAPPRGYILCVRLSGKSRRLTGERVELRTHERRYFPLYATWYGDKEIWRLTSWSAMPLGRRAVERLFEDRELSNSYDSFAVHLRDEPEPIGVISLMNLSETHASADLSVILGRPEDRARGYGAEAIELILRYGFEELGLHRVALSVFAFNEVAIAAYRKIGFREEGRLRDAIYRDGAYHDAILMSILAPNWRRDRDR